MHISFIKEETKNGKNNNINIILLYTHLNKLQNWKHNRKKGKKKYKITKIKSMRSRRKILIEAKYNKESDVFSKTHWLHSKVFQTANNSFYKKRFTNDVWTDISGDLRIWKRSVRAQNVINEWKLFKPGRHIEEKVIYLFRKGIVRMDFDL